jgi:peptide-methionine (R)-S-oxide reductase
MEAWMTSYTKPPEAELREKLTPQQYHVTQKEGTEPAFNNEYWDNKQPGIYVDVVTGEPLSAQLINTIRERVGRVLLSL